MALNGRRRDRDHPAIPAAQTCQSWNRRGGPVIWQNEPRFPPWAGPCGVDVAAPGRGLPASQSTPRSFGITSLLFVRVNLVRTDDSVRAPDTDCRGSRREHAPAHLAYGSSAADAAPTQTPWFDRAVSLLTMAIPVDDHRGLCDVRLQSTKVGRSSVVTSGSSASWVASVGN